MNAKLDEMGMMVGWGKEQEEFINLLRKRLGNN
jgi:hypothetical protein